MPFKIRNTSFNTEAEEAENARCEKLYREYLKQFDKRSNRDLWKFFAGDFFHDGRIGSIRFEPGLGTVTMTVDSPNIRRLYDNDKYEYVGVDFECTFRRVTRFAIDNPRGPYPTEWSNQDAPSTFLYSEINTCLSNEAPLDQAAQCSLLIETIRNDSAYITIVFSQVDVVAKEPAAFALMEADPRFFIPVYREESAKGANNGER